MEVEQLFNENQQTKPFFKALEQKIANEWISHIAIKKEIISPVKANENKLDQGVIVLDGDDKDDEFLCAIPESAFEVNSKKRKLSDTLETNPSETTTELTKTSEITTELTKTSETIEIKSDLTK